MILSLNNPESTFRVYSVLKGQKNFRKFAYWGAFPTFDEAVREKTFAEDAFFEAWIETGKLKWYEKAHIEYKKEASGG